MVDALYVGIPILCSDCPSGRREFIDNNERGVLYNQKSNEDFLKSFSYIYSLKPNEIKKLILNAKKHTRNFTAFKNFLKFSEILN